MSDVRAVAPQGSVRSVLEPRWWAHRRGCIVVVHTRDGLSYKGALADVTRRSVVLRAVVALAPSGEQSVAGEVGIPADNVSSWQDLGPKD